MPDHKDYKDLINEIIKKQSAVLGPDIAFLRAKSVTGLKLDNNGQVVSIVGDEQTILQGLVDKYIELSGEIVKNILNPVFAKYPSIDIKIK